MLSGSYEGLHPIADDVYVRIDADIHVQHPVAIDWFVRGTRRQRMAIVPQVHHSYDHSEQSVRWRISRYAAYFGEASIERALWRPYYNAGVFALGADAPHWEPWARYFADGITASHGELVCDQSALNAAIDRESLPVTPLPAICNWLCHLAPPLRHKVTREFFEPGYAGRPIAMLHMSAGRRNTRILRSFGGNGRRGTCRFGDGRNSWSDSQPHPLL